MIPLQGYEIVESAQRELTPILELAEQRNGDVDHSLQLTATAHIRLLIALCIRDNVEPAVAYEGATMLLRSFRFAHAAIQQAIVAVVAHAFRGKHGSASGELQSRLHEELAVLKQGAVEESRQRAEDLNALYDRVCADGNAAMALMASTTNDGCGSEASDGAQTVAPDGHDRVEGRIVHRGDGTAVAYAASRTH